MSCPPPPFRPLGKSEPTEALRPTLRNTPKIKLPALPPINMTFISYTLKATVYLKIISYSISNDSFA